MLLPLIGLIMAIFASTFVGVIVISIHPKWKFNLLNVVAFNFGSIGFAIITSILYGKIFAYEGELQSAPAVIGFFISMITALICGGTYIVFLLNKFSKNQINKHN